MMSTTSTTIAVNDTTDTAVTATTDNSMNNRRNRRIELVLLSLGGAGYVPGMIMTLIGVFIFVLLGAPNSPAEHVAPYWALGWSICCGGFGLIFISGGLQLLSICFSHYENDTRHGHHDVENGEREHHNNNLNLSPILEPTSPFQCTSPINSSLHERPGNSNLSRLLPYPVEPYPYQNLGNSPRMSDVNYLCRSATIRIAGF